MFSLTPDPKEIRLRYPGLKRQRYKEARNRAAAGPQQHTMQNPSIEENTCETDSFREAHLVHICLIKMLVKPFLVASALRNFIQNSERSRGGNWCKAFPLWGQKEQKPTNYYRKVKRLCQ
ncbi:uncharacterized protein RHO17_015930 [Thomomys bottae]